MEENLRPAGIIPAEKSAGWEAPEQRALLVEIFKIPLFSESFFLGGGTCLSVMYFGHRQSQDLDLFTVDEISIPVAWGMLIRRLPRRGYALETTISISEGFASGVFQKNGVMTKVDLVQDMFVEDLRREQVALDGVPIRVDDFGNLVTGKFSAFLSRGEPKDIIDLSRILEHAKDTGQFIPFLERLLTETSKRDALADDNTLLSEIFTKIEQQHSDLFNPGIARMVVEFLDAVQHRKKALSEGDHS